MHLIRTKFFNRIDTWGWGWEYQISHQLQAQIWHQICHQVGNQVSPFVEEQFSVISRSYYSAMIAGVYSLKF